MTPTLLVFNKGYTHSYMSYRLTRDLSLKPKMFDPPLNVSTPNGNQTLVDKKVGPVFMQVHNKSIVWEFAMYHFVGIDLILGMGWLDV